MRKRKPRKCPGFCSLACICVYGSCPDIPTEYDEAEYSNGIKCSECAYNTGKCSDCIFENSEYCVEADDEKVQMVIADVLQEYYNMEIEETDRWLIARDDAGMREVRIERIVKNDQDNQTGQPGTGNESI